MNRPILKELSLEPYTQSLSQAAERLEQCEFKKVKTKYTKGEDENYRKGFSKYLYLWTNRVIKEGEELTVKYTLYNIG